LSSSTPSKLDSLLGLDSAKRLVRELARGDIGAHAVLFYGAPGGGKMALSRILAQAWLCRQPTEDGADGVCKACAAFERGNNPDFLHIAPTGGSRIVKLNAIAETEPKNEEHAPLITFFRTMPLASSHRVAIIEDAHRMNADSSNALLKTLEEPHEHARMILTTDSVGGVRSTILSRCLAVACELPDASALVDADPDIVALAGGSPGRVRELSQNEQLAKRLLAFASQLHRTPREAALTASEQFRSICEAFGAVRPEGARSAQAYSIELLATYFARDESAPPEWTQSLVDAHRRIQGNGSAALVFDAMFIQMLSR